MLRATRLPSPAAATVSALRPSLVPFQTFSSLHCYSRLRKLGASPPPLLNPLCRRTLTSPPSLAYNRASFSMPMVPGRPRPRALSSPASGSGVERELLVQHLLVKEGDENLLVDFQRRIARGEDLGDLAAEYSICPSKQEGGLLGWVKKGQMVPEFEEAAFTAPLNKVVSCKTQFGWHLLQVLSEREECVLREIQPKDFHVKFQDPEFLVEVQLIDVREPDEVAKASLPSFEVLPLRQFGTWGPEITTKLDPQKDTYVMCHHGMRSLQVAKWLQSQGFQRVYNLTGGIHAYATTVDPTVPTY
ncbi:unnamed protein product [Linum trigynum]|uniref:Peptidylprolyl isomerase n=1 Tax=Linum trigynum TaxID=586398 RepID=A0AAV2FYH7_9ROSI